MKFKKYILRWSRLKFTYFSGTQHNNIRNQNSCTLSWIKIYLKKVYIFLAHSQDKHGSKP